jgi:hypothetical protein
VDDEFEVLPAGGADPCSPTSSTAVPRVAASTGEWVARTTWAPVRPRLCSRPTSPAEHGRVPDGHQMAGVSLYLLFAHEPYYPLPAREIHTCVVAAACLLHPRIKQPDGKRIHRHLVRGRRPGEIVPLATLTQELGGGAHWGDVGDWETVVAGLVRLNRSEGCDALSLGLAPRLPRTRARECRRPAGPDPPLRLLPHRRGVGDRAATAARPGLAERTRGPPEGYCHRQLIDAVRYLVAEGVRWASLPTSPGGGPCTSSSAAGATTTSSRSSTAGCAQCCAPWPGRRCMYCQHPVPRSVDEW